MDLYPYNSLSPRVGYLLITDDNGNFGFVRDANFKMTEVGKVIHIQNIGHRVRLKTTHFKLKRQYSDTNCQIYILQIGNMEDDLSLEVVLLNCYSVLAKVCLIFQANVVCRQLGYNGASDYRKGMSKPSHGEVVLSDLSCPNFMDLSLNNCTFDKINETSTDNIILVSCNGEYNNDHKQLRSAFELFSSVKLKSSFP